MGNNDFERKRLEIIFREHTFAPIFKINPKYCVNQFAGLTPYISHKDIINNRIYIRGCPIGSGSSFDSGQRDIIVEYNSLDALINDGWRLE